MWRVYRPPAPLPPTSAGGTSYTFREPYFMGWLLYYCNKWVIVLTDRWILLLQIRRGDRPGVVRSQVRYSGITQIKRSHFGNTVLKLGNGKKLRFTRVPKGDAKSNGVGREPAAYAR